MRRLFLGMVGLMLGALLSLGCAESSSDRTERGEPLFYFMAPGGLFRVEELGAQTPVAFTRAPMMEDDTFIAGMLRPGAISFFAFTGQFFLNEIDLFLQVERPRRQWVLSSSRGFRRARLGWAGRRVYLLTEMNGAAVLGEMDVEEVREGVIRSPVDGLGPGREKAVSFDLSFGGNQAYVLYESGVLYAYNLYLKDEAEGEKAHFPAGSRDLQLLEDGSVFVAADSGLYRWRPGGEVEQISSLDSLLLCRLLSREMSSVVVLRANNEIHEVRVQGGTARYFLTPSEPVKDLIPLREPWVKPTRVFAGDVMSSPPYLVGASNLYQLRIVDPDGPNAMVTAKLSADHRLENVFFDTPDRDTVLQFHEVTSVNILDLSFYGGDLLPGETAGTVRIHVTALSADGQQSEWEYFLPVVPPGPL